MANYYNILGVPQTSSREDLKKSYHNLVLEHHPDKTNDQASTAFHLIDEAWKVLSDNDQRKRYDAKLKASESETTHPVQEEIKLSDTLYDAKLRQFEKGCRCGGGYVLDETDVCDGGLVIVDCDNCSLSVVVDCENRNKGADS